MAWVLCAGPTSSHAVVESAAIVRAKGANVASTLREHASATPFHDEHLAVLAFHVKHHAGPGA